MLKIKEFIKKEIVLIISFLLCLGSTLFVKPSADYIAYIDFRTLGLLFSLMAIMAGLSALGVFRWLAEILLNKAKSSAGLYLVFVLLCFFSSMLITNDVALVTFVPFTIIALGIAGQTKRLIYVVSMETIAANLGSMLTPIGNPQNLYLFSNYDMEFSDFTKTILPYSALSLFLLLVGAIFARGDRLTIDKKPTLDGGYKMILIYIILFITALLSVFRLLDYRILVALVFVVVLVFDRQTLKKVDYSLLLTFVFLFVFIGNLGNIKEVAEYLNHIVVGNEVAVGILSSQVFSNVPACLLLSGFTPNVKELLVGVNLGGLGTLIASMASLISFKLVQKENIKSSNYIFIFSILNIVFLAFNMLLWYIIK